MEALAVRCYVIFKVGLGLLHVHRLHIVQERIVEVVQWLEKTRAALLIIIITPTTYIPIIGIINRDRRIDEF